MSTLRSLAAAAASSRSALVRFAATDERDEEQLLDVLAVAFDGERWIVAAWDEARRMLRVLDTRRIRRVRRSRRVARPGPPPGFDGRDFAWHHWLDASLGLAREVAMWVDVRAASVVSAALPVTRATQHPEGGWLYRIHTSRPERLAALANSLSPYAEVHFASEMTGSARRSTGDGAEARLLRLAAWLLDQGEPVTRERILEAFPGDYRGNEEAVEKKFTRDKDALRRLGYVIETVELGSRDEQVGYVLSPRACTLPSIGFSPQEAALVWSAGVGASRLSPHPMREDLESALRKLVVGAQGLPPRAAPVEELASDAPGGLDKTLERLVVSWERRKRITIEYWRVAAGELVERQVDVYGWASRRGEWIFVGYCHLRKGVRIFYLSRVRKLRVNGVRAQDPDYRIPADFDIRRWSRQEVWDYDVHPPRPATVRFRGSLARLARQLLPGATVSLDAEGGRLARLEVRNLRGLARQALAWGPEAELTLPEDGRAMAREILNELARGTP